MQKIQLNSTSISIEGSISSTSILKALGYMDRVQPAWSLHGSPVFGFRIYPKPGNAYSYLPYGSYHARHVFRGWLKAEVQRLLTHFSNPSVLLEECSIFYKHLQDRGYPVKAIDSTFRVCSSNWNQRRKMLEPKTKSGGAATGKHKSLAQ